MQVITFFSKNWLPFPDPTRPVVVFKLDTYSKEASSGTVVSLQIAPKGPPKEAFGLLLKWLSMDILRASTLMGNMCVLSKRIFPVEDAEV